VAATSSRTCCDSSVYARVLTHLPAAARAAMSARNLASIAWSSDLHQGLDACDATQFPRACFEFAWIHPPYWRQKVYSDDSRCLSRAATLEAFLERYRLLIANCIGALVPGGKLAILMGDYCDSQAGFVPLVYHSKSLAFEAGLRQCCTDIIRFSHGASSSNKSPTGRHSFRGSMMYAWCSRINAIWEEVHDANDATAARSRSDER